MSSLVLPVKTRAKRATDEALLPAKLHLAAAAPFATFGQMPMT